MKTGSKTWLRLAILAGLVYFVVGVGLTELSQLFSSNQVRAWRLAAWVISGIVFAVHICYEFFRLRGSRVTTALHAALGVMLGAFLLAVSANIHGLWVGSSHPIALAISLVVWPALIALPAFVAALATAAVLTLRRT